jgi:flavin-dependent dehydrogenase
VGLYTYDVRFKLFPSNSRHTPRKTWHCGIDPRSTTFHWEGACNTKHAGKRVFIVGDAGGFGEPILGEGISYAIRSGQIAAGAVIRGGDYAGSHFRNAAAYLRKDWRWLTGWPCNFTATSELVT